MTHDLQNRLRTLYDRTTSFTGSPAGRRVVTIARISFLAVIVGYLVWRFSEIGWAEIIQNLPADWRFYAIFLVLFFALPVTESLIYRLCWGTPLGRNLAAFIKKRVYNKDFVGYSGEAYLYAWARQRVALPARRVLGIIKDNLVLSAAASTVFAVALLALFLVVGDVQALGIDRGDGWLYLLAALGLIVVAAVVGARFRRRLFALSGRLLVLVFVLHFFRLAGMNVLQVIQWDIVIPGIGWQTWFVFLAAQVVISRLPVLPARDLLFLSASVELAAVLGIARAEVAAMLLVISALDKALNLVLFVGVSVMDARRPEQTLAVPGGVTGDPAPSGQ